jgi:AraC family transcriptional regulator
MRNNRVLYNQNKLYNEITTEACYLGQISDFSIHAVLKGNEKYSICNRDLTIFPGNFLFLNAGTHYNRMISSNSLVNSFSISFSPEFIAQFQHSITSTQESLLDEPFTTQALQDVNFMETIYPCKGDIKFNLQHLIHHFCADSDEPLIDDYLYHFLLLFYQLHYKEILNKSVRLNVASAVTRNELIKRLCIAKYYILSNYNQPVSLDEIARQAYLSPTHLYRTFKQVFHCSPHQYLIKARLDNARYMLQDTDYLLVEIVNLVGFTCPSTFIKLFKKRYKVTPLKYRFHNKDNIYSAN